MPGFRVLRAGIAVSLISLHAPQTSASAEASSSLDICLHAGGSNLSFDEIIAACTAAIDSGAYKGITVARAFNERGWMLIKKKEYVRARADFDKSLEADPGYAYAYNNRSIANRDIGDVDAAISDAQSALRIDNNSAMGWVNLGTAYSHKGDMQSALQDFGKAIAIDPKLSVAYLNRGFAIESLGGDLDLAIRDYEAAIAIDPGYALAFSNRGWARRAQANASATEAEKRRGQSLALSDANTAIKLAPLLDAGFITRGYIWLDMNETVRALDDFNEAVRLEPKPLSLTGRGLAYERTGDAKLARVDFEASLALRARHINDSRAQEVARQRLAALNSKPAKTPPIVVASGVPSPIPTTSADSAPPAEQKPPRVESTHSAVSPIFTRSLDDDLAACSQKASHSGQLSLPGPDHKDIALPKCYQGRADLDCRIKAISDHAGSIQRDYGAIADAGYRKIDKTQAICSVDLGLVRAQIKQSETLDDNVKKMESAFQAETECLGQLRQVLDNMKPGVDDSSALRQDVIKTVTDIVQEAGTQQQIVLDLLQNIKDSQDAMHAVASIRESICP